MFVSSSLPGLAVDRSSLSWTVAQVVEGALSAKLTCQGDEFLIKGSTVEPLSKELLRSLSHRTCIMKKGLHQTEGYQTGFCSRHSCPRLFINWMDSCLGVMMQCKYEMTLQGIWVTRARVATRVARKRESAVESHSHIPRYQCTPSGTNVWLQHIR